MVYEDEELIKLFIEESLEHIVTIGNDLLKIEEAGIGADADLVNRIFRAIHSIKGGVGGIDIENVEQLAHSMETVIGKIRSHEIVPDTEIVNTLLLSTDILKNLLLNLETNNSIDISETLHALKICVDRDDSESLPSSQGQSILKDASGNCLLSFAPTEIDRLINEGKSLYIVYFNLVRIENPDLKDVYQLFRDLQKCGEIIDCQFDYQAIGTLDDERPFKTVPFVILYGSSLEIEIIRALSEIKDTNVYEISPDEIKGNTITLNYPLNKQVFEAGGYNDGQLRQSLLDQSTLNEDQGNLILTDGVFNENGIGRGRKYSSLRVSIDIIDKLMNLAAEFVLGRNQLLQSIGTKDFRYIELAGQRIDGIATKLQETIMLTRLQPIGTVFNKFPRIVRDLAGALDKKIKLTLNGENVELDKTILEAIGDPLTHMIRNSIDHGIETPEARRKAGKNVVGNIQIKAYHEAGQVCIQIVDDGKGIDGDKIASTALTKKLISKKQAMLMSNEEKLNLIFLPGFSTSDDVTSVSGRGVGMDVVKSNLDKLGGLVNIHSQPGKGTIFLIKLPLTLAIIPCQIVMVAGERYAIPQVSLDELVGIQPEEVKYRIERIGNAEVVRVRDEILPLIRLADIFHIENDYYDKQLKKYRKDRRKRISDRRGVQTTVDLFEDDETHKYVKSKSEQEGDVAEDASSSTRRDTHDRRYRVESMVHIVVVTTGALRYGIVVDKFYDPEEIVVKPLGRHFKRCQGYAGATIMGDGRVCLIIDVLKLAQMANLVSMEGSERAAEIRRAEKYAKQDFVPMLVFRGSEEEYFTVPLGLVDRIEKVERGQIEFIGGKRIIPYKGHSLILYTVDDLAGVQPIGDLDEYVILVFSVVRNNIGLMARMPVDAVDLEMKDFDVSMKQPGIMGSLLIDGRTTLIVDIINFVFELNPKWRLKASETPKATILLVDDSEFSRAHVRFFLAEEGYQVIEAIDGMEGLLQIDKHADSVSLVVTDLNMPNMDGFLFSEQIRLDRRFEKLPIIALTNAYSEEEFVQCDEIGIDDYQVNFDRVNIIKSVCSFVG